MAIFALFILVFIGIIVGIIYVETAERRIPIQYANKKRYEQFIAFFDYYLDVDFNSMYSRKLIRSGISNIAYMFLCESTARSSTLSK